MERNVAIKRLQEAIKSLQELPKHTPVNLVLHAHAKRKCPICGEPQGRNYVIIGFNAHYEHCSVCGYITNY